jgi:hypothetical protein
MSRPKDLPSTLQTWASGNYAAGPAWGGTAKRQAGAVTELTPGVTLPAEIENYLHGNAFDLAESLLVATGQSPAINWLPKSSSTHNLKRGAFCAKNQTWYLVGDGGADFLDASPDFGRSWVSLTGSLGSVLVLIDAACDTAGNVVLVGYGSRSIYKGTYVSQASTTWAATANALSVSPTQSVSIDFEPTSAKFVTTYRNGVLGHKVDWSANGTVWSPGTLPANWTAYTGTNNPEIACIAGQSVAVFVDATTPRYNAMYSTDGGNTWANANIAPSISGANLAAQSTISKPTYDSVTGTWYFAVSSVSGTRQTEVWSSTNPAGGVWTRKYYSSLSDIVMQDLQAIGTLLVASNDDGRIVFSVDGGVSWKWCACNPGTTTRTFLRAAQGGLLMTNAPDKAIFSSMRIGNGGLAV